MSLRFDGSNTMPSCCIMGLVRNVCVTDRRVLCSDCVLTGLDQQDSMLAKRFV